MTSPAQTLPALILEKIIEYTVGEYKWKDIRGSVEGEEMFRFTAPLLGVCSTWREAALDRIFRDAWWCSNNGLGYDHKYWFQYLYEHKDLPEALETGNISRVKSVRFHSKSSMVLDGSLLDILEDAPFSDLVLSEVTAVEFRFEGDLDGVWDTALLDSADIAQEFCDEINQTFPNAKTRTVSSLDLLENHSNSLFVRTLMSGLVADVAATNTSIEYCVAPACLPNSMANIRSISIGYPTIESPAIELIRRNADTLEYLEVLSTTPAIFSKIVVADDGTPVVYSCLKTFKLLLQYLDNSDERSSLDSPAGIPFPSLGKLVCGGSYPFGNDILFRGNERSLEYLDIWLCPRTAQILKSHGILTPQRFSALRFANGLVHEDESEESPSDAIDFFLQLAANANVLTMDGAPVLFCLLTMAVENFGRNITVLELPNIAFTLQETLELVRQLPHLNRLGTDIVATQELHSPDRTHDNCYGECRNPRPRERMANDSGSDHDDMSDNSYDSYDSYYVDSYSIRVHIRDFFFAHQDAFYAAMDFAEELYRRYYPLSKTLVFFDVSEYSCNPMASCKIIALLCALCPTIRRVKTHRHGDVSEFDPIPIEDSYIERHEIEETEQYNSLVSRLQLSNLSTH